MGKFSDAIEKVEGVVHLDSTELHKEAGDPDQQTPERREPQAKPTKREKVAEDRHPIRPLSESAVPQVPIQPSKLNISEKLIAYHAPHSIEAEQFRKLRTNILFPPDGQEVPRVILITSALPGEGKSFVSANLAVTISQNVDKHVLLMDCDMRRPDQHKIFDLPNDKGLSNFLNEGTPLKSLLVRVINNRLSLLRSGPPPSNPAELLSSDRMSDLLQEVRSRYHDRTIIVDSPPPQLTAESFALAKSVDGILLVIKMGHTHKEIVSDLTDAFGKDKILGVVANWMSKNSPSYGLEKYSKYKYYSPKGTDLSDTVEDKKFTRRLMWRRKVR